ncbi:MAG: DUF1565 domain-containing protein, partial [Planctomycetes bacterium]|nr:DUF1565 domain-containing protein [Planctomycetota bacterium]
MRFLRIELLIVLILCFSLFLLPSCGCDDDDDDDSGGSPPDDDDDKGDDDTGDDDTGDDDTTDDDDSTCNGCLIDSDCYDDGDDNPDNNCEKCDVGESTTAWTNEDDGATCDDGLDCTDGNTCAEGVCTYAEDTCPDNQACTETGCVNACFKDEDRDGHGTFDNWTPKDGACPYGTSNNKNDCDDEVFLTHKKAFDLPDDGIDQDCDGELWKANETDGIFVAEATRNTDAPAGTMADPFTSITDAIAEAVSQDKTAVFVAEGTYDEEVQTTSVSLFGGYHWDGSSTWTRDPDTYTSTINSSNDYAVRVKQEPTDADPEPAELVIIEGFTLNGDTTSSDGTGVLLDYSLSSLIGNTIDAGQGTDTTSGVYAYYGDNLIAYNEINGGDATGTGLSIGIRNIYGTCFAAHNNISGATTEDMARGISSYNANV